MAYNVEFPSNVPPEPSRGERPATGEPSEATRAYLEAQQRPFPVEPETPALGQEIRPASRIIEPESATSEPTNQGEELRAESSYRLPTPTEIARRAAAATGYQGMLPDIELEPDTQQDVFFSLADDRTLGTAAVRVARSSTRTVVINGQEIPEQSSTGIAHIGRYDPGRQKWLFYPECVNPEEQEALGDYFEEVALVSRAMLAVEDETENPTPFVDLRHPLTVHARSEMDALLTSTGVAARLITDKATDFLGERRTDEATTCTLVLIPKLYNPAVDADGRRLNPSAFRVDYEQSLSVVYEGLIDSQDGKTRRGACHVSIADRSQDGENLWVPNLAVITADEWEVLARAPQMLQAYRTFDPSFSTDSCAVVHNYRY